jgi:hypothetical protein
MSEDRTVVLDCGKQVWDRGTLYVNELSKSIKLFFPSHAPQVRILEVETK